MVGNPELPMKHCEEWDYNWINHLPNGAGFRPFTVSQWMVLVEVYFIDDINCDDLMDDG